MYLKSGKSGGDDGGVGKRLLVQPLLAMVEVKTAMVTRGNMREYNMPQVTTTLDIVVVATMVAIEVVLMIDTPLQGVLSLTIRGNI